MKKIALIIFLIASLSFPLFSEDEVGSAIDYQKEITELSKSIEMLQRWQSQYLKKERSFEAHNKRVLFRSESTSDGKRAHFLAQEARANALELQEQIDVLISRKKGLEASK